MIYVAYDNIASDPSRELLKITSPAPYGKSNFYYSFHLPAIFMARSEDFRIISTNEALGSNTKFLYALEFYSVFTAIIGKIIEETGNFKLDMGISPDIIKAIREERCVFLLSDAAEGRTYDFQTNNGPVYLFDFIADFISENDLPPRNIWFVSGNANSYIDHEAWKLARQVTDDDRTFNFVPANVSSLHLRTIYQSRCKGMDIDYRSGAQTNEASFQRSGVPFEARPLDRLGAIRQELADPTKFRTKDFINLNNNVRSHRQMFVALLGRENLLERGFVSLNETKLDQRTINLMKYFDLYIPWEEKVSRKLPMYIDLNQSDERNIFDIFFPRRPKSHEESYINFVTETWFFEYETIRHTHVTEKSFRPIIMMQPFVIIGRSGSLSTLRRAGYWTFSDLWDESYDKAVNNKERFSRISALVESISKLSRSDIRGLYGASLPMIEHNFHTFLTVPDEWDMILQSIGKSLQS